LVDTAGLRANADPMERLGIQVSEQYLGRAHVVVACAESIPDVERTERAVRAWTQAPVVGARTKSDIGPGNEEHPPTSFPILSVSALQGRGLEELLARVTRAVTESLESVDLETPVITRTRHRVALLRAREEMAAFRDVWATASLPAPVAAVRIRAAGAALDELIGPIDIDDVFARVFSTFCVGK
jgi:tRNA modification GTPase